MYTYIYVWHVARGARTLVVEAEDGKRVVGPQLRELVVPAAVVPKPVRVEHHSPAIYYCYYI